MLKESVSPWPHAIGFCLAILYVALGWAAVVPAEKLAVTLTHEAITLIVTGGILYSIGGVVYATRAFNLLRGRFGFHELFHVFVVAAATLHFVAIAFHLTPGRSTL